MVKAIPTVTQNVQRILRQGYNLADDLVFTEERGSFAFAWPVSFEAIARLLLVWIRWKADPQWSAWALHGTGLSRREPMNRRPNLHWSVHFVDAWGTGVPEAPFPVFFSFDVDQYSPYEGLDDALGHLVEFGGHTLTGSETDQADMAERIEDRFGGRSSSVASTSDQGDALIDPHNQEQA